MSHQPSASAPARQAPRSETTTPVPEGQQAASEWALPLATPERAMVQPGQARPAEILALQRMAGNRAVSHLLAGGDAIQARLTVGPAQDHYEQEADRVAEQVVAGDAGHSQPKVQRQAEEEEIQTMPLAASITPLGQRHTQRDEDEIQEKPQGDGSFDAAPQIEHRLAANRGGGSPLPAGVRAYMEPRFGADFSGVHLHTGPDAAVLNRQVQAQAFTHGRDVYLGEGRYEPGTDAGKRLLAHELTHVVQQTGAGARPAPSVSRLSAGLQREVIQRAIPTPQQWKENSKVDWKRRSSELKAIDAALTTWDAVKNSTPAAKLTAVNKLWYAILNWQATKKEGGRKSQRDLAMLLLKSEVRQVRDGLQPGDDVATLTLNVDVESDDPHNRTLWELKGAKVGHAWMTLKYDAPDATGTRTFGMTGFNGINLAALDAGSPQKAAFGFYPDNFRSDPEELKRYYGSGVNRATLGKSALVQPDTRHDAKAQQHYRVSDASVHRVADFVEQSKGHDYSLTGYNCVSFAKGVIEVAGHVPPPTKRMFMDQANKAYRSVVRLGRAGDSAVDDRVEMVRHLVADNTKTYNNLAPEEAKAIALVMRDHKKVCREAGLYDAETDILPTVRRDWQTLTPAQRIQVLDPATRMAAFATKLSTHTRLYALQMAAVLMSDAQFDTWLQADKLPVQGQLVAALGQNLAKNYQNLSLTEAKAIIEVTFTLPEVIDNLGILNEQDLIEDLYRIVYAHRDDSYQIEDPRTRVAAIQGWIATDGGFEGSNVGRLTNMQFMAMIMDESMFDQWWSKYAKDRIDNNVAPT